MADISSSDLQTQIETALKAVTDSKGKPYFVVRNPDGTVPSGAELAEGSKKLIEGIAKGIAAQMKIWQATLMVTGTGLAAPSGGGPVTGATLPGSVK